MQAENELTPVFLFLITIKLAFKDNINNQHMFENRICLNMAFILKGDTIIKNSHVYKK